MAFTDAFSGVDGDDVAVYSSNWTRVDGSAGMAQINASGQVKNTTTDTNGALYTAPDCGTADHYAQAVLPSPVSSLASFMACVRAVDRSNWIGSRGTTTWQLYKRVSGTFSLLSTGSGTPASNDVLKVSISGTSVEFFVNGSSKGTAVVSDAVFSGVQKAGFVVRATAQDPLIDDWESTQSGGGGTANAWYYRLQQEVAA